MNILVFLAQEGPRAKKHTSSWIHPLCTVILHYMLITASVFCVHDLAISEEKKNHIQDQISSEKEIIREQISTFSFIYFLCVIIYRVIINRNKPIVQKGVFYEATWLCNNTMFISALGLWTKRDIIVLGQVVAVSIDQVLWYVDLSVWILSGFKVFPIGVIKYLTWPDTTWAQRVTCTHHLWTIPLFMYACNGFKFPIETYFFSFFIIILNVLLSRYMTPIVLESRTNNNDKERTVKYLNINLGHEVWKDIKLEFIQIQHDNPPANLYLFRLLWRWQVFNGIVLVMVLYPLSLLFYPYG